MPTLTITRDYADGQVLTEAQLDAANDSIETFVNVTGLGSDNIQDNSIGAAEIQTSAITEVKIAADAVTTNKIADATITEAKLVAAVIAKLLPPATVTSYGGDTAPTGWLLCDGTAVSRITYSALFAVVGTRFGTGDTTTTFNLPDLRGRFVRGYDGSAGRDPDSAGRTAMNTGGATGNNVGSVQAYATGDHQHSQGAGTGGNLGIPGATGGSTPFTLTTGISVGNTSTETRPVNAGLNHIIKT